MVLSLDISKTGDGWTSAAEGIVQQEELQEWIGRYFGRRENLSGFLRRNCGVLELTAKDLGRGYVFSYRQPLNQNPEGSMFFEKLSCKLDGRKVVRYFGDPTENLFGFYWEI